MMIKVCGMREAENIREVEALGIDLIGFIFWPKSSRYVSKVPAHLPTHCQRVGVFVDARIDDVLQHISDYQLDIVQLHGHESPYYIECLHKHFEGKVIKAFNIATTADLEQTTGYKGLVDYFLFDTKGKSVGGNGEQFDWSVLAAYDGHTPFLLSGGIGPDDAEKVRAFHHDRCIGIDLNSRFEVSPALKDISKLKQFLENLEYPEYPESPEYPENPENPEKPKK